MKEKEKKPTTCAGLSQAKSFIKITPLSKTFLKVLSIDPTKSFSFLDARC
jgi:hypothetical protein